MRSAKSACFVGFLVTVLAAPTARGQDLFLPPGDTTPAAKAHATWQVRVDPKEVTAGGTAEIVAAFETAKGWYIYAPDHTGTGNASRVEAAGDGVRVEGSPTFPPPKVKEDEILGETVRLLEGKGEIRQRFKVSEDAAAGDLNISAKVHFMSCSSSMCDPPQAAEFSLRLKVLPRPPQETPAAPDLSDEEAPAQGTVAEGSVAATEKEPEGGGVPAGTSGPVVIEKRHVEWRLSVEPAEIPRGGRGTIVASYDLRPGWHLYAPDHESAMGMGRPTRISWKPDRVQSAGGLEFPDPITKRDASTLEEVHRYLSGRGTVRQPIAIPEDASPGELRLELTVDFMTCDARSCDPPDAAEATLVVNVGKTVVPSTPPEPRAEPSAPAKRTSGSGTGSDIAGMGLLELILAMVVGGLLTLAMPCLYPMIPITIAYFTKQAEARGGKVLSLALAYGAGIVLVFNVIGWVFAGSIGPFAAHPIVNALFGLFFVLFALSLIGLFEMRVPSFINAAASQAGGVGGYAGVFLLGVVLVVTSFACTAPILGGLLVVAVQGADLARVTLGMTAFGTTIAIPFVLLSLFPARARSLPRAGEWMHTLKVSLGFLMIAAAMKFFSNAEKALGLLILPRELYLMICAGIFGVWSLYLLGVVRLKGETSEGVGSLRMFVGLVIMTLAAYLVHGAQGFRLDPVTTAFTPNYPAERIDWDAWTIVEDDLEAGLARARTDGKRALLNFTGITCVNCQQMEGAVFPKLENELRDYVEVRLHTDKVGSAEAAARSQRFQDYKVRLTGTQGNPMYVVVDPGAPEKPISVFAGKDITGGAEFGEFLRKNARG